MPNLAVLGGPPVAPEGLAVDWPCLDESDRAAVLRALESRQWSRVDCRDPQMSEVLQLEDEFARYHDAAHCLALANGTAALQVALKAAGVRFGDEVICSTVTWYASAAAIIHCGAVPVFADMVADTYQLDPDHVASLLTPRTRALVAVHYAGYPADLDRLGALAQRHQLAVIEDCSHAQGTEWRGRKMGAHGTAGTMSFQESKSLTCGEGGAVLCDDEEFMARAFSHHHYSPIAGRPFAWTNTPAPNFRLGELQAALLRAQLVRLPHQTRQREENGRWLAAELRKLGGVDPLRHDVRITTRGYYFFVIRYDAAHFADVPRDLFVNALVAEGIRAGIGYGAALHRTACFTHRNFGGLEDLVRFPDYTATSLPISERALSDEQITIGNHALLGRANCERIVEALAKLKDNLDELRLLRRSSAATPFVPAIAAA